ncbi:MAG: A/G-specific adenine glycosylase [Velocimicrobium sp.]
MYDYLVIIDDLLMWYEREKRELKWRTNPLPYYVWVSEIMLQQTRVEAVKAYFERFTKAFPQIEDLAEAPEEKLMKLWEGLGYYSRVRNLGKAAKQVMEDYEGILPNRYEELRKLPGIGSYTAGAISSIAYGYSVPAVDGNVLRVTKRLAGSYEDISKAKVKSELERVLQDTMVTKFGEHGGEPAGAFNQAMMELGAMVCIPNGKPLCEKCPVQKYCVAYKKNIAMEIPVKAPKKARRIEEKTIFIFEYDGKVAIHKRPEKGLLAKLWEFPNTEDKLTIPKAEKLLEDHAITDYEMELLGEAKHIFSHVEWHMLGYRILIQQKNSGKMEDIFPELIWVPRIELEEIYALPTAFSAYR